MTSSSSAEPKKDNWSATTYNKNASFVYSGAYTNAVVQLLDPQPEDHILDLGCGSGELTLELAPRVASILGVDSSRDLLDKFRRNIQAAPAADGEKITLIEHDGQELASLPQEHQGKFDAVFSSAAVHWMKRSPSSVASGVYGVLKPGGRWACEMGGYLCLVGVRATLHDVLRKRGYEPEKIDPFYFPTATTQRKVLEKAGFRVESCEIVTRINPLPTGLEGWLETFGFAFLDPLSSAEERKEVIAEVCDRMKIDMWSEDEGWTMMYTRCRFKAWKD